MKSFNNPALAPGSLVLVTGVNGLIGSHVVNQVLEYGYKVRGTVRDVEKSGWMKQFFSNKFGEGLFELVEVKEMETEGAFDKAVQGVSGVIHVASIVDFNPDLDRVVKTVVDGTVGILKSAGKEGVQRFVLTSSSNAVYISKPNNPVVITTETWNEEAVELAFNPSKEYNDYERGLIAYSASKVLGEQALWKWAEENESKMVVNSVIPGGNFGKILSPSNQGFRSTTMFAAALFNNETELISLFLKTYDPEWFIDVQDCARLHVAALLHQGVSGERIFAWGSPFNWNVVLAAFRKMYPDRKFMDDTDGLWDDLAIVEPVARAELLLKEMGQPGFTTLDESLKMTVES